MAKKDKVLDILAMAQLSDEDKLARLAHRWIGKAFPREQAKAIVQCYLDANGRTNELVDALMLEKARQEKIHNDRAAFAEARKKLAVSPMQKYRDNPRLRERRIMQIAQATFGPAVRENFNEDTLALMSLISGEDRWYQVKWKEAGFKPLRSVLVEVVTVSPGKGPQYNRFLLYRHKGRVLVARTTARTLVESWGGQLPESFMLQAGTLKQNGWSFSMDYEDQSMVVTKPGEDEQRIPWTGRTVDE